MLRRTRLALAGCVLALVLLQAGTLGASAQASATPTASEQAPTAQQPTAEQQPVPPVPTDVSLSNERTLTTWAHPAEIAPIYAKPESRLKIPISSTSRVKAKTKQRTFLMDNY